MRTKTNRVGKFQELSLAASTLLVTLIAALAQTNQPNPDATRGTPGVATQRAVVNFAELARQAAPSAAALPEADLAAPAGFNPANMSDTPPSPTPASSFQALDDDGSAEVPDTHGAVGPNHLMVTHNFRVRIQDRSGAIVSTVSLTNFWSPVGPFPPRPANNRIYPGITDPKVIYQPFDQRWIHVAIVAGPQLTNSALLIGVSQTDDPTGNWNLYRLDTSAGGQLFLDAPNVGYNKDWIVVQGNILRLSDGALLRSDIYVFNKTNLYAGGAGLFTRFERPDQGGEFSRLALPAITLDNELGTIYLLGQVDNSSGRNLNQLRLSTITGPVGAEVFTVGPVITTTNRWDNLSAAGFADFAPQLGSTRKIDIIDAVVMGLVYRNGSIWAVQNVFLPAGGAPTRTAIQWWQVSPSGEILQRGLVDDPSGQLFYGYPTLAVNKFDDLLVGYSRFGSNQYASANYAFRAANDPPHTLRSDTVLKAGEAPYYQSVVGHNRWGDFSATTIDPVNDVDLWTIQEYAASPSGTNSRWGTWWGRIVPPNLNLGITGATVTEGDSGSTNAVFNVTLSKANDQTITVDFATADGSATAGQDYIATNGTLTFNPGETNKTITVSILGDVLDETNETFFVTLSNPTNIVLAYTQAQGTILDNDPVSAAISINDITVREGDAGLADATFMLSLSTPSGLPISVRASTANGAATLRVDYVPTNIVVIIPPGATSQPVTIKIISDTLIESNETFFVNLNSPTNATIVRNRGVCTILDDDFRVTTVEFSGSDVRVSFTTATNQTYRVERTDDLSGIIVWTTVPGAAAVSGTGAVVQVTDAGAAGQSQRFYRVRFN